MPGGVRMSYTIKEFLNSFRSLITEEIFEAFVLRRIRSHWTIIGCKVETICHDACLFQDSDQSLLKIYTLEERYDVEPLYVIINYKNEELEEREYPQNKYMNADMSDVNLMDFIESMRFEDADNVEQILTSIYHWIESVEFPNAWDCEVQGITPFWEEFADRKRFKLRMFKESRMTFFNRCLDIFKSALGEADEEWVKHLFPTWIQEVCLTRQGKEYHLYLDGAERVFEVWLGNNRYMEFFIDINTVDENSISEFREKLEEYLKMTNGKA